MLMKEVDVVELLVELKNRRGLATCNIELPLPLKATKSLPGTKAKVNVMRRRIEAGFHPHHPDDSKFVDVFAEVT